MAPAVTAARVLSVLLLVSMVASSGAGLLVSGLYQDPEPFGAMLRGYDLVALVLAAPTLAAVLLRALRRSPRARLLWVAVLAYAVYDYAFYVFGTAFNDLFLLHVAAFSLAVFALVLALATFDVTGLVAGFRDRTPVRSIGGVLLLLGVSLGVMWSVYALRFAVTAEVPDEPSRLVLPTAVTHLGWALDLSLLVPGYLLAGVLLWRRAAWGYVLAAMMLVSGVLHQVAYLSALVFQVEAGVAGASAFDPAEVPIVVAYVVAVVLLLYNCPGVRRPSVRPGR
jgi:hypothetical protein